MTYLDKKRQTLLLCSEQALSEQRTVKLCLCAHTLWLEKDRERYVQHQKRHLNLKAPTNQEVIHTQYKP